ncbi:hypothetical protein AALP_AA1G000100 [Arabis alpina]|uniref:NAC domain-containing protein n=1 Tax=Arabis alpina TaxID=50452 RepID=A0A087HK37_ARAAL|nr:hypothetical protein AALP_AA1G000100 [Arabis alpina]
MVNPTVVGYRFRPTDVEMVDDYLRPKNIDSDTSHVDRVISTVNIYSFDPWDLPYQSIMKSEDQVWYFFGRKENKYNRGDRQIRTTESGFWKKTGKPTEIKRKSGNREKIGEKCVLVFHLSKLLGGSKTKWVMHEYQATQMMMTYTLCKVTFKGEDSEISSSSSGCEIERMNNSRGLGTRIEGTSFERPQSQEQENPLQSSGFLDVFEETQFGDLMRIISNIFRPTDVELVDNYLRPKNDESSEGGDTSNHVDRVFNTINISSYDPWKLRDQSIMKSEDQVWYFFGRKENKYNRGDRQIRKTKSGYWKKTGKPTEIKRKNGEKIGEKWVLVFHMSNKKKTKWVLHEYHLFSPDQITRTYTVCKVKFKGEASEISSPPGGELEHNNHSSITQMNNSGGSEGTTFECPQSQEVENPPQLSGLLDVFEETQPADAMLTIISNMSNDEFNNLLNDDEYEQRKVMFMQENRSNHGPKKPITSVFIGYSSDDDDDDSLSAATGSIQTSSGCDDSFGSSNHRVDQITELKESPNSTIMLCQKVNQTTSQDTKVLGQEKPKNKRGCFFYRTIQRFIKKI